MKRFFLPIAVAALCGLPEAAAISADYAQAELTLKANDAKVEQVVPRTEYFATKDSAKNINPAWHFVRIPYSLQGKSRGDKTPLYVDELKVHAYLVFAVGKDGEKLILVDKEITYVNIPLSPKGDVSENKNVQAAVFISPSDAARICGSGSSKVEKVDLGGKLAAVAVEFKFKDADCGKPEADADVLVNKKMKNKLKKGWWKKEDKAGIGVQLRAISETPFAPFYAPAFPATSPMYGEASGSSYTSSSSSSGSMSGYTPAAATESTTSTDSADTATTEEPVAPTKKSRKRRK
ncbi:MAG: hypothetical protein IJB89_06050 [Akkermansia sp.]|nr:hypothetical protein [Akkermansia sp.]MBQ9828924.1 hypothetical protein [Akkermansia sp.]